MKRLNMLNRKLRIILSLTMLGALAGCGGGGSGDDTNTSGGADTQPPVVSAPANTTVAATDASGTAISDDAISHFLNSATATDNVDQSLSITNDAPANIFPLGNTEVTFSATDSAGNTGTARASVNVVDLTPPVITLLGDPTVSLTLGQAYHEAGATALDNVDSGVLTAEVTGEVNINIEGSYTLTYNVTDAAGNSAVPVIREVLVGGAVAVACPKGVTTSDSKSHDCHYQAEGEAQGNFRLKYPNGEWISIGCSNGKPVADNSNTQWVHQERAIRIVDGDWLNCPESENYGAECTCDPNKFERFHGISKDYEHELGNGLIHGIGVQGGGFVFNNSAHQTCLGIHKQGQPGEIESIASQPNGSHYRTDGKHHEECPIFCLGDACPE